MHLRWPVWKLCCNRRNATKYRTNDNQVTNVGCKKVGCCISRTYGINQAILPQLTRTFSFGPEVQLRHIGIVRSGTKIATLYIRFKLLQPAKDILYFSFSMSTNFMDIWQTCNCLYVKTFPQAGNHAGNETCMGW